MAAIYDLYGVLIGSSLALTGAFTLVVLFGNWIWEKISPKVLMFIGGFFYSFWLWSIIKYIFSFYNWIWKKYFIKSIAWGLGIG